MCSDHFADDMETSEAEDQFEHRDSGSVTKMKMTGPRKTVCLKILKGENRILGNSNSASKNTRTHSKLITTQPMPNTPS
ncbi:hypothetical protein C0J52_23277 [Blattella germanica]|nr:hypothetical protein C0J52_23277 [Blattella germanica]